MRFPYITKKQIFQIVLGVVLIVAAVMSSVMYIATLPDREMRPVTVSTSTPSLVKVQIPVDLTGNWIFTKGEIKFAAEVQQGMILIKLIDKDGSLDYYYGSLENPMTNGAILSTKDKSRISWSQGDTKEFIYQDESLTFTYGAMGVTASIKLKRGQ